MVMVYFPGLLSPFQSNRAGIMITEETVKITQGTEPQMVMVPVYGTERYIPYLFSGVPPEFVANGYQPLQLDMPPPYNSAGTISTGYEPL